MVANGTGGRCTQKNTTLLLNVRKKSLAVDVTILSYFKILLKLLLKF